MSSDSDELWFGMQDMRRRANCAHEETDELVADGKIVVRLCSRCGSPVAEAENG